MHTQKKRTQNGLYYPFSSEGSRAEGRESGWLPVRERATRRPRLPGAPVRTNGPRAADAEHAGDEMTQEPEHAGDGISCEPEHALVKTGRRFFPPRSSKSTRLLALRSFCLSRARSAHRGLLSLGGTRRIPLFGAQPSEPVHDHIWEWNSSPKEFRTYQRARGECRELRVVAVRAKMALLLSL